MGQQGLTREDRDLRGSKSSSSSEITTVVIGECVTEMFTDTGGSERLGVLPGVLITTICPVPWISTVVFPPL